MINKEENNNVRPCIEAQHFKMPDSNINSYFLLFDTTKWSNTQKSRSSKMFWEKLKS